MSSACHSAFLRLSSQYISALIIMPDDIEEIIDLAEIIDFDDEDEDIDEHIDV